MLEMLSDWKKPEGYSGQGEKQEELRTNEQRSREKMRQKRRGNKQRKVVETPERRRVQQQDIGSSGPGQK